MEYSYRKLRGRIIEKYDTHQAFARAFGIAPNSLSLKLCGKTQFTQEDIEKAADLLDIPRAEFVEYFFK